MPLICGEFFNSVAKILLLLFVPKAHEVGVFGMLILARVLERILSWKIHIPPDLVVNRWPHSVRATHPLISR